MTQAARIDAAAALRDEFALRGRGPALLAGAAGFGLAALAWHAEPAWRLGLSLWLGYATGYGAATLLARRSRTSWGAALALLALAALTGAAAGAGLESALGDGTVAPARAALHLAFAGMLLFVPFGQAALRRRALARVEAERARVQAELQMLQAQIEPHFLFNTLATLRSFVRLRSDAALPLLDRMTAFLEAVLPQARDGRSTLGRELHIVEQYLAIMALRMGERLRWHIAADTALRERPLPPLLLQPLVENAVLHGIEPCEAGGAIAVEARADGATLEIVVVNTGRPLGGAPAHAGHGVALRNLAQRLDALHGAAARFELAATAHGTEARLTLPLQDLTPETAS